MPTPHGESNSGAGSDVKGDFPSPPLETYHPGVDLASQGEPADFVYFVAKGFVKLTNADAHGNQSIVELVWGGGLVGAESALLRKECSETATTIVKCRLARWRASQFAAQFGGEPDFTRWVGGLLSQQICTLRGRFLDLARLTAPQRLEVLLRHWAEGETRGEANPAPELDLPLARHELAEVLTITPCHLSRLLRSSEKQGRIQRGVPHIRVCAAGFRKPRAAAARPALGQT
jgi:CRP-like cAMP-binding protein